MALDCTCHREIVSHELCCGHDEGRDPDCPRHGDGYGREPACEHCGVVGGGHTQDCITGGR